MEISYVKDTKQFNGCHLRGGRGWRRNTCLRLLREKVEGRVTFLVFY